MLTWPQDSTLKRDWAASAEKTRRILVVLAVLFGLRIAGQVLVEFWKIDWLPPSPEWFSGRIPYPWLLACQLLILLLMFHVIRSFTRGTGWAVAPRSGIGRAFLICGSLYALVMVIRYVVRMSLYPVERWWGGCIPIVFHLVLATFVLVWGWWHWSKSETTPSLVTLRRRFLMWSAWVSGSIVVLSGMSTWVAYLLLPSFLAWELGLRGSEYSVRADSTQWVETSNGIRLATWVYHPHRAPGPTPTILVRIPLPPGWFFRLTTDTVARMWAERGYAVVVQPVRGRAPSEGTYEPFVHERNDGIATLSWISRQPWSNGRIGMWGGSYFAYTQWVLADRELPGLSACQIIQSSTSFREMFHPGGAFALESALYWALTSHGATEEFPEMEILESVVDGWPVIESDNRAGHEIPFFNRWAEATDDDGYWKAVDGERRASRLRAPALLLAGWYDPFLTTQLQDYAEIQQDADPRVAEETRLVIGPWSHAWTVHSRFGPLDRHFRLASLADSVPWFDRHLMEKAEAPKLPRVRIFVMGANEWREEAAWPLSRAVLTPLYFSKSITNATRLLGGRLTLQPEPKPSQWSYEYDPRHPVPSRGGACLGPRAGIADQIAIERRDDVLVFSGDPLPDDLEVTGPIVVTIFVSSSAPGTDFVARLCDVHPDGHSWNVTAGIQRVVFDDSGGESMPPRKLQIKLPPTSMVFRRGHRLRVHVTSSSYPHWDRHPNTRHADPNETAPQTARQTIFLGTDYPSRIDIPVVPIQGVSEASERP